MSYESAPHWQSTKSMPCNLKSFFVDTGKTGSKCPLNDVGENFLSSCINVTFELRAKCSIFILTTAY